MIQKRVISPLISGLIFPGAGQLLNGQYLKGSIIIVLTILNLLFLVLYINWGFQTLTARMSAPTGTVWQFIGAGFLVYGKQELCLLVILFVIWVFGIVDAHLGAPSEKK
jgi:hypothetical protein